MGLFKKKMAREVLVSMFTEQAFREAEQSIGVFSSYIGGDAPGEPLTADSKFAIEVLALHLAVRGGGFMPGPIASAPGHLEKGIIEMAGPLMRTPGARESFIQYIVPWKAYRLGDDQTNLVASIAAIFRERTDALVKIHQPGGLQSQLVERLVGKLVEMSVESWRKLIADFKIVE